MYDTRLLTDHFGSVIDAACLNQPALCLWPIYSHHNLVVGFDGSKQKQNILKQNNV